MISILIPIYNYNCYPLVQILSAQVKNTKIEAEIICMNDASDPSYHPYFKQIQSLSGVRFISLTENTGRSAIRNKLADESQYPWLLFLDNDGIPEYSDFLLRYLQAAESHGSGILCGGRSYELTKPDRSDYYLHWLYGTSREVQSQSRRNENRYNGFQSNNFLIDRNSFNVLRFDESIEQYGHEDSLFGIKAEANKIPIYHIDNPVRHMGLEKAEAFLCKAEIACHNAWMLFQSDKILVSKAMKLAYRIQQSGFHTLVLWALNSIIPLIKINLLGKRPLLVSLDLYKLHYILKITKS
jgi:GT2 family glycosyltransferase